MVILRFMLLAVLTAVFPVLSRLRLLSFPFIFVLIPGTIRDGQGYVGSKMVVEWLKSNLNHWLFPVGMLGRGLVVASPLSADEMERSPELAQKVHAAILALASRVRARYVAIAGRGPTVMSHHDLDMSLPLTTGVFGTVYTVVRGIRDAVKGISNDPELQINVPICIIGGGGVIGSACVFRLKELGFRSLTVCDIRFEGQEYTENEVLYTARKNVVGEAKLTVILTAKGDEIAPYIPYFVESSIAVDDTHPQMPQEYVDALTARGVRVLKMALRLPGMNFRPPIPGYYAEDIPGCVGLVVTYTVANCAGVEIKTQAEYDEVAEEIGFEAVLRPHYYGNYL